MLKLEEVQEIVASGGGVQVKQQQTQEHGNSSAEQGASSSSCCRIWHIAKREIKALAITQYSDPYLPLVLSLVSSRNSPGG